MYLRALLYRLSQALLVALVLASLCFVFINTLPGDMALRIAVARYGLDLISADLVEQVRTEANLQEGMARQYLRWMGDVMRGELGRSLISDDPVMEELRDAGALTCRLAGLGWALSYVIALPLGIAAGLRPGGLVDRITALIAAAIAALPSFLIGIALITIFSIALRWLPPAGYRTPAHLVLPAATLALGLSALSVRIIRTAVAEANAAFHVTFSRVRGLSGTRAFLRHVLRNAAVPVVTFAALQFAVLLDGFVVVETLFNYPGLGNLLVKSLIARDVPVVLGGALAIGVLYALVSLVADLACLWLDPRRSAGESA